MPVTGVKRVNFDVTPELYQVIEDLTARTHSTSKAEMMRKAIALMKTVQEAQDSNQSLIIADDKNQPVTRVVL